MLIFGEFGVVEIFDSLGDWRNAVTAARVSRMSIGSEDISDDLKLLRDLLTWGHLSPFEHITITFRIDGVPLYSAEQLIRYRTARVTKRSYRYVNLLDIFEKLTKSFGEDSEIVYEMIFYIPKEIKQNLDLRDEYLEVLKLAIRKYKYMIEKGVDEERARGILPTSLRTEMYYTIDARNLFHIFEERISKHAQPETREIVKAMFVETFRYDPILVENWVEIRGTEYLKNFLKYIIEKESKEENYLLEG